jgi:alkylated DNA nucleotide flippase Atl1
MLPSHRHPTVKPTVMTVVTVTPSGRIYIYAHRLTVTGSGDGARQAKVLFCLPLQSKVPCVTCF